MTFRIQVFGVPGYPGITYFELADAASLEVSDPLRLFRNNVQVGEWPLADRETTIREQVTAIIDTSNLQLDRAVVGAADIADLKYPELAITRKHRYGHVLLPDESGLLSRIIAQTSEEVESPAHLYDWVNTLASDAAYAADSPVSISEWQWFHVRNGRISVRRDFRPSYHDKLDRDWRDFASSFQQTQHLRGNTLWIRALAHYHEGLTLQLPAYQLLAFYKGCETLAKLRSRIAQSGYVLDRSVLSLPEPLANEFQNLHERPVQKAVDWLYSPFRNLVAHYESDAADGKKTFVHSDLFDDGLVAFAKLATIAKLCFRETANTLINAHRTANTKT